MGAARVCPGGSYLPLQIPVLPVTGAGCPELSCSKALCLPAIIQQTALAAVDYGLILGHLLSPCAPRNPLSLINTWKRPCSRAVCKCKISLSTQEALCSLQRARTPKMDGVGLGSNYLMGNLTSWPSSTWARHNLSGYRAWPQNVSLFHLYLLTTLFFNFLLLSGSSACYRASKEQEPSECGKDQVSGTIF